ncbi:MAG: hypothetical protein HY919_07515 [Elusimicrobia bacterium]|nr:hypothetical protein [Elusimicrobiota bacterium]
MELIKGMINTSILERDKLEKKYENFIHINNSLNRQLVSFQANKKIPIYNWFSFKEGFSSEMVRLFIEKCPKKTGTVLDPFAGSCTTLLTAREMGFDSIGIELMPLGDFILKSKLILEKIDFNYLVEQIKELKKVDFELYPDNPKNSYKHIAITEKAFSPETERKLNGFLNYINILKDERIKQVFSFACFCILDKISYTRKDGQCLRWDYRAEKGKSNFDKGKIYDFEDALFSQLNKIISDLSDMQFLGDQNKFNSKIELKTGSLFEILPQLKNNFFDLVISSPPYCNRYDYTRIYALELVYLGLNEDEIKNLRQNLLSATVENKDKIEFIRKIYEQNNRIDLFNKAEQIFNSSKSLQEILKILNRYKEEKKLNNPGIYRMLKNYFYEHAFVVMEMARCLKKGGRIYYVNDNVRYAGEVIPVDLILSEFAANNGLEVKEIYKLPTGKGNSSQQMGKHGRVELRKCVYVWEKI